MEKASSKPSQYDSPVYPRVKWNLHATFEEGTWAAWLLRPAPAAYHEDHIVESIRGTSCRISRDTRRNSQRSGPTCAVRCRGRLPCQLTRQRRSPLQSPHPRPAAPKGDDRTRAARYAAPVKPGIQPRHDVVGRVERRVNPPPPVLSTFGRRYLEVERFPIRVHNQVHSEPRTRKSALSARTMRMELQSGRHSFTPCHAVVA